MKFISNSQLRDWNSLSANQLDLISVSFFPVRSEKDPAYYEGVIYFKTDLPYKTEDHFLEMAGR